MSHPRLNNPRARMARLAEAARIKRPPRHAFQADQAISALWHELSAAVSAPWAGASRPMYQAGTNDVAVLSFGAGFSVWCCKGEFMWRDAMAGTVTHPANDPAGAAARVGGFAHTPSRSARPVLAAV
ncbi:hypothetical protein J4H86_16830 [Spiractinospora alimapuensis]|nr:hypothetical protein J4H86_16830 [Spiractinospora alimapuensis]